MYTSKLLNKQVAAILSSGGVGVAPTDTVYGILARAASEQAVDRVFRLRERTSTKPCIILISSPEDMLNFGASGADVIRAKPYWPAPITLIFNVKNQPQHLTRGKTSLAFRMPDKLELRKLIKTTGPLIAPSANPETQPTAATIKQAKKYFASNVDFYVGTNTTLTASPSTILDLTGAQPSQIR